jgi:hypothetical protein
MSEETTKIIIFKGYWTINDVKRYPHALFVYGDNNAKIGKGGQAIIRDLSNTIGIPTKKYPSNRYESFYTDSEYQDNINHISNAINNIITLSKHYKYVVLPEDGFGTGFADLPNKAPKTYAFLVNAVNKLKKKI